MRVVIRFSIDNEKDGKLRNTLLNNLKTYGITLQKHTATYQNNRISERNLGLALRAFWRTVTNHTGSGRIDHFWLYTDRWSRGPYKKKKAADSN